MNPSTDRLPLVASRGHTVRIVSVFLGFAVLVALQARRAAQAHDSGALPPSHVVRYTAILALQWGLLWFALAGTRRHGVSLRDLVGGRWASVRSVLITLLTSVVFLVAANGVLLVVKAGLAWVGQGTTADEQATSAFVSPHGWVEGALWVVVSASAGFCEEVVFRGYLQRQFAGLTNNASAGIVISAVVFGLGHLYQGWRSVAVIMVFGLLFGLLAQSTKTLRPGIVAHAVQDVYAGLTG